MVFAESSKGTFLLTQIAITSLASNLSQESHSSSEIRGKYRSCYLMTDLADSPVHSFFHRSLRFVSVLIIKAFTHVLLFYRARSWLEGSQV